MNELVEKEPWLSSTQLVVKPDMLFGKRGKSGLVALNLDLAQVASFVKERLGKEVIENILCGDIFIKRTHYILYPETHYLTISMYFHINRWR